MKDEAQFLTLLPVIDEVVDYVCRRHRLTAAEAADFAGEVRLHFIERNYEPLRRFEGRSSVRTYLTVVIQRVFLDSRNRLWGKWRPSAAAKRLGPPAILLERLVTRDGWSIDQASEILRVNHGITLDAQLSALCDRLSIRPPSRQIVSETEATAVESATPPTDANVVRAEHDFLAKRVQTALDRARQTLAPDEQLILKMRFEDGVPVADIAHALHRDQKRLYRTIERLLAKIRESLEAAGVSREDVRALFADGALSEIEDVQQDANAVPAPRRAERERIS